MAFDSSNYCWGRNVTDGDNNEIECRRTPTAEVEVMRNTAMGFVTSTMTYCTTCLSAMHESHTEVVLSIGRMPKKEATNVGSTIERDATEH